MDKKIEINFENDDFLVINKPSGMTTTKERKNEEDTLEDYLHIIKANNLPRNGIVHRLDKGTSGLVLVAKNNDSLLNLKHQFKARLVAKKYYCLVSGDTSTSGAIDWPIGRSKYSFGKFGVSVDGKRALTEFNLINRYLKNNKKYSLLDINLKTGRTHQIRVHLSYLRWPLVGDSLYGGENDILKRPFLHAHELQINDPKTGKRLIFESPLPSDLVKHLELYEKQA
ncbi:MAG: RluA family pseudouridine synthase [Candidatus Shapirobacteria bacterium]|nr:RluA family pseudouridine synthase [Candidatus Shapirobacteria bacterium]